MCLQLEASLVAHSNLFFPNHQVTNYSIISTTKRKSCDFLSYILICYLSSVVYVDLHYNALGWIFVQIRQLSWLQWHPFSVSSSPLDGENHIAVLIKVLGDWTQKLERRISENPNGTEEESLLLQPFTKLTASVEGPYGHESAYHLTYEVFTSPFHPKISIWNV